MFKRLQQKWKVNGWRLLFILITFAIGGSLTGYLGKKAMGFSGIENTFIYVPVYIIVVTLIWPVTVLAVSLPLGQFLFFKTYIRNLFGKIKGEKTKPLHMPNENQLIKTTGSGVELPQSTQEEKIKLAIFASGAGSNAAQIINYFKTHSRITVALIVCNKPRAGVLNIATAAGIATLLIEKDAFFNSNNYLLALQKERIDFIVLAGFLWKIPQSLIAAFPKRIINIHPALLPKFGGKGMYGNKVHAAVLQTGEQESGITIHYVDEHYDNGAVIFQAKCPVVPVDTPESLAQRIHQLEHAHFSKVIEETVLTLHTPSI